MTVGNVYEDPRGKVGRDGKREHVFVVRLSAGGSQVVRRSSREEAELARAMMLITTGGRTE